MHPRIRHLVASTTAVLILCCTSGGGAVMPWQRAYLGVEVRMLNDQWKHHLDCNCSNGVVVVGVQKGSPAEAAGIECGDVLTHIGGTRIDSPLRISEILSHLKAGQIVTVQIWRKGKTLQKKVKLSGSMRWIHSPSVWLGIKAQPVPPSLAAFAGVNHGVVVNKVMPSSPALQAGIEKGDIITAIDGNKIESPADISRLLAAKKAGDEVKVRILRRNGLTETTVKLQKRPEGMNWNIPSSIPWVEPESLHRYLQKLREQMAALLEEMKNLRLRLETASRNGSD